MRSITFFLVFWCFAVANTVTAQHLRLNYRAGYNMGQYSSPASSTYHKGEWNRIEGWEHALQFQAGMGKRFYFQTELAYYQRAMTGLVPNFSLISPNPEVELNDRVEILQLPVMVGLRFGEPEKLQIFAAGGMNIGFLLDKKLDNSKSYGTEVEMNIEENEFGVVAEAGLSHTIKERLYLGASFRYNWAQFNTRMRIQPQYLSSWRLNRVTPAVTIGWVL